MLSASTLTNNIRKIVDPDVAGFVGWQGSYSAAAAQWRNAIVDQYSANAEDVSGDTVLTLNGSLFESTLAAGLGSSLTIAASAQLFTNAWVALWTGATFGVGSLIPGTGSGACQNVGSGSKIFASEATSIVTTIVPTGLQAALEIEFADLSNAGADKAASLASIFHLATTTNILVLITGVDTGGPPQPVTNLCTVF